MAYIPDQSKSFTASLNDELLKQLSGYSGLITSSIAEPIAGLNALMHLNPDLVDKTRAKLTVGNPANVVPNNLTMPEWARTGIGYFNESADRLGAISPVAGAALKTAPAFVGAMLPSSSRKAFSSVGGDIKNAITNPTFRTGANAQRGYISYSGSPVDFDKFDSSKLGDDGIDAYGHGIYLSDSPDVAGDYATGKTGTIYKVNIDDKHIDSMLDWDAPLSKQPENVQDVIRYKLYDMVEPDEDLLENLTGGEIMDRLASHGTKKEISSLMNSMGIKGIRYADDSTIGKPLSAKNTVIFDDSILEIKEKRRK